jgi:hypothetical protein
MPDASAQALTKAAILYCGQPVTFQRLVGQPPSVTLSPSGGAAVSAVVRNYLPDTTAEAASGYSASELGAITEGERLLIVMAADLAAAGFSLPVQKGDQVVLSGTTGELLVVTRADAQKRYFAGAIEVVAVGVA